MTYVSNGVEFKVGDKVRIVRREESHAPDGMGTGVRWANSWVGSMQEEIGVVTTITSITSSGAYLKGVGMGWALTSLENLMRGPAKLTGVDGDGVEAEFTLDDIKDYMRVRLADGIHVVYTNARSPELSKYVTNGTQHRKLVLAEVLEVYSQPEGRKMMTVNAIGRLRFKPVPAAKLAALKATVEAAKAALATAEAALKAGN